MQIISSSSHDAREQALYQWASLQLGQPTIPWQALVGDAGVRRYFRIAADKKNYLAVDSPVTGVDNPQFIAVAQGMAQAGLHVPTIFAVDLTQGFVLIDELSCEHYLDILTEENADILYHDALCALIKLQSATDHFPDRIKPWDAAEYYAELTDMPVWFLQRHFNISLSTTQQKALEKLFARLIENMQIQPQVLVHRDYHSRNLLYCAENNPGIIDFQDLFLGPITYDVVSLLRDAYIVWPWERVEQWLEQFYRMLVQQPHYHHLNYAQFIQWFHGMTLQRSIKVLGRFARLCYRDHKPRYLTDLPPVVAYALTACAQYPDSHVLQDLLQEHL